LEQLVTIELFGQSYTFKSESEGTKAEEMAEFLKQEVTRVETRLKDQPVTMNKLAILLLATLNIVNEHFEQKRSYSALLQDISGRSTNLLRLLDENIESYGRERLQVNTGR
jgi:cell division protein ZapA (FtsZ GTPase activity inhibitor)